MSAGTFLADPRALVAISFVALFAGAFVALRVRRLWTPRGRAIMRRDLAHRLRSVFRRAQERRRRESVEAYSHASNVLDLTLALCDIDAIPEEGLAQGRKDVAEAMRTLRDTLRTLRDESTREPMLTHLAEHLAHDVAGVPTAEATARFKAFLLDEAALAEPDGQVAGHLERAAALGAILAVHARAKMP